MSNIGRLYVEVDAKTGKFKSKLKDVKTQSKRAEGGLNSLRVSTNALGVAMKGLGALGIGYALFRGFSQATREVIKFQRAFANVTTLVDTSQVNIKGLRKELLSLSGHLGSATELTGGLYQAISAGAEPASAVKLVGTAAKFAKAALTDTFTAVDVMTTVINAYGKSAKDASKVSDILFETIKQGKTTGQELASSLGRVIPTAATLGVELEELGAAVATLTKGGFSTEEAITSLNQTLVTFLKPQAQAVELAKSLGIELSSTAFKSKGLLKSLKELAVAADGNASATATFFGNVRALKGVLALTGPQAAEFERILNAHYETLGNVNEAAEKQKDTIGAQLTAAWNNLTGIWTATVGEGRLLVGVLSDINSGLEIMRSADLGTALKASEIYRKHWDEIKQKIEAAGIAIESIPADQMQVLLANLHDIASAGGDTFSVFDKGTVSTTAFNAALDKFVKGALSKRFAGIDNFAALKTQIEESGNKQLFLNALIGELRNQIQSNITPSTNLKEQAEKHGLAAENLLALAKKHGLLLAKEEQTLLTALNTERLRLEAEKERTTELGKQKSILDALNKARGSETDTANRRASVFETTPADASILDRIRKEFESADPILIPIKLGPIPELPKPKFGDALVERQMMGEHIPGGGPQDKEAQIPFPEWLKFQDFMNKMAKDHKEKMKGMKSDASGYAEVWKRQISTIFTDFSRQLADSIIDFKGWKDTLLSIVRDFARTGLRIVIEGFFTQFLQKKAGALLGGLFGGDKEEKPPRWQHPGEKTATGSPLFKDVIPPLGDKSQNEEAAPTIMENTADISGPIEANNAVTKDIKNKAGQQVSLLTNLGPMIISGFGAIMASSKGGILSKVLGIASIVTAFLPIPGSQIVSGALAAGSASAGALGYAKGGIIREPASGITKSGQRFTIGEKGPEAIVPLTSAFKNLSFGEAMPAMASPAEHRLPTVAGPIPSVQGSSSFGMGSDMKPILQAILSTLGQWETGSGDALVLQATRNPRVRRQMGEATFSAPQAGF